MLMSVVASFFIKKIFPFVNRYSNIVFVCDKSSAWKICFSVANAHYTFATELSQEWVSTEPKLLVSREHYFY